MRTLGGIHSKVVGLPYRADRIRVSVKDAGGTFRDLSNWGGTNWINSVSIGEDIDSPHRTADVTFKRETFAISISPFMQDSPLNRASPPHPANPFSSLLALNREVKIEADVTPMDGAASWMEIFRGYIDSVDPASGEDVTIGCRDLGARVANAHIERERVYGYASAAKGLHIWKGSTAYALNDLLIPSGQQNGHYFKCTTAGTSGTSEPVFPTSGTIADGTAVWTREGSTTTSGVAVETVIQSILDDNVGSVTLYTPTSPSWVITEFQQQREPALDGLRALADQIGWDLRYAWRAGTGQFELTFYAPPRAKTTPDHTFGADDYESINAFKVDMSGIRNAVRVIYSDKADTDSNGVRKRKTLEVTDSASITKYGRLFSEIAESDTSNIDTSTEATTLANNVLSDLAEPYAETEVSAYFFPWVELGDLYRFSANGLHFSTDQDLAVVGYRHEFQGGEEPVARTVLQCRGKPSGGFGKWLAKEAGRAREVHRLQDFNRLPTLELTPTVGGTNIIITGVQTAGTILTGHEVHISTAPNFTPGTGTLAAVSEARSISVSDLIPGGQYYAKIVPYGFNSEEVVKGEPYPEESFVAGVAGAQHITNLYNPGEVPFNYQYASRTRDITSNPPDRWEIDGCDWASNGDVYLDYDFSDGAQIHFRATASNARLISDFFPVSARSNTTDNLTEYVFKTYAFRVGTTTNPNLRIVIYRYNYDLTAMSPATVSFDSAVSTSGFETIQVPFDLTGVAFARISLEKQTASASYELYVAPVQFIPVPTAPIGNKDSSSPSLSNSWAVYGDSSFRGPRYWRDSMGIIHIEGAISSGTATPGTVMFTLATWARPAKDKIFPVMNSSALGHVRVKSNGDVTIESGSNTWLMLDGITFRTDA